MARRDPDPGTLARRAAEVRAARLAAEATPPPPACSRCGTDRGAFDRKARGIRRYDGSRWGYGPLCTACYNRMRKVRS